MRKFSDGRTDRQAWRETDKSNFIGRCPTNVERLKINIKINIRFNKYSDIYEEKTRH